LATLGLGITLIAVQSIQMIEQINNKTWPQTICTTPGNWKRAHSVDAAVSSPAKMTTGFGSLLCFD